MPDVDSARLCCVGGGHLRGVARRVLLSMTSCPTHGGIATQQDEGQPQSRFYRIQHRISDRFGPDVAAAFMSAVEQVRDQIDMEELETAVRAGNISRVEAALKVETLRRILQSSEGLSGALRQTFSATGDAAAGVMSEALDLDFSFDARDPLATQFVRTQAGDLIKNITDDQLLGVRGVLGRAFVEGIPPRRAARHIHGIVGIRQDWAQAPLNMAQEIREGQAAAATSRRLDAATKQRIRQRIRADTVTEDFINDVTETYRHSLRRRRARDIARTETIRASSAGQQAGFEQAQRRGALPDTARRFWVVTPDDRLRETHAAIPGMNPNGVKISEPFDTPMGARMYPPAGVNCRCSVSLAPNPGESGVI